MSPDFRNLPLNALRAFEAVARLRSFTAGADALNIAQSACSRHIARLEEVVGRRLFVRTGRAIRLTEAGERLLPVVQQSFDGIAQTIDGLRSDSELRLHVPPTFVQTLALPFVQQFRAMHAEYALAIYSTLTVGIPDGDFDVAIIFDRLDEYRDERTLLWRIRMTPLCSPPDRDRLAAAGLEASLRREDLLHVQLTGLSPDFLWRKFAQSQGVDAIKPSSLTFETAALAIEFARAGAGLALADTRMATRGLASRDLAAPFDTDFDTGFAYYLVEAPGGRRRPGAAALRRYIAQLAPPGSVT